MLPFDPTVLSVTGNELLDDIVAQLLLLEKAPEENGRLDLVDQALVSLRSEAETAGLDELAEACQRQVDLVERLRGRPDDVRQEALDVMHHFVGWCRGYLENTLRRAG